MNTADVLLKKRDYLGLLAISSPAQRSRRPRRAAHAGFRHARTRPPSYEVVREIAETEGASQAASLQHRIVYLADIGMLSPMIGLLGTVVGIINVLRRAGQPGRRPNPRATCCSPAASREALVATASGLILGITAMVFYSFFRNRVQSLISDLEIASTHILGLLALNYNKRASNRASVRRVLEWTMSSSRAMNFRSRAEPDVFGFQIAPMVDILLVLLGFFIVTWNFALSENELDVKIPNAAQREGDRRPYVGPGRGECEHGRHHRLEPQNAHRRQICWRSSRNSPGSIPTRRSSCAATRHANYKSIVDVLDICRQANIWNVAFATAKLNEVGKSVHAASTARFRRPCARARPCGGRRAAGAARLAQEVRRAHAGGRRNPTRRGAVPFFDNATPAPRARAAPTAKPPAITDEIRPAHRAEPRPSPRSAPRARIKSSSILRMAFTRAASRHGRAGV